jgi:3-dehydroquinate dehydratase-2
MVFATSSSAPSILLLSGPNLNLLGSREPSIYGSETLADHVSTAMARASELGGALRHLQTNKESEIVEAVHAARGRDAAIIINPGAFTHYSWALADALAAYDGVVIELHLSNPDAREPWRRTSVVSPVATATLSGLGGIGYRLAVDAALALLRTGV